MDSYYADLATSKLNDALKNITEAMQYLHDATPNNPTWIISNLSQHKNGINNRINDILAYRQSSKGE